MKGKGTLAERLGTTVHESVLLRRIARHGLTAADAIAREAQLRGLDYYIQAGEEKPDAVPISEIRIEELVIALIPMGAPKHASYCMRFRAP